MTHQNVNELILQCKQQPALYTSYQEIADKVNAEYNLVGSDKLTRDAVRCRWNRMRRKDGIIDSNPLKDELTREARVENRKNQLQERADRAIEEQREHEEAITQIIADAIRDGLSIADIKPYEVDPNRDYSIKGNNREEGFLMLSDLHFGKKTHRYNLEVAKERLHRVLDAVIKLGKRHELEVLNIALLGDIVDGESIYPSHPHHIDASALSQIFASVEAFVPRLRELAKHFKKVRIFTVPGNHGRVSKHYNEKTNFDSLFAMTLDFATRDIPNLDFHMNYDWKYTHTINGVKFLMFHGHQIKMTLNLPHYGITTRISRWASTENLGGFDVAVHGHFHSAISQKWNNVHIFSNGTIVDGDEFALEFVGLEATQTQWFYGIHPEHKVTFRYELSAERKY